MDPEVDSPEALTPNLKDGDGPAGIETTDFRFAGDPFAAEHQRAGSRGGHA
jgi:hypothetical protein